jgi:hypothetical protein
VADSINVDVVSESSGPLTPTTKKKKRWENVEKKPASDVVSESSGPVESGAQAKGQASVSTGPAPAAVSVKPCGYQDGRLKQDSESSGLAAKSTSSPRGPAAATTRASASAGPHFGPAPWQKAGYQHPSRHNVDAPPKGQKFHRSVNNNVLVELRKGDHRNYLGVYMDRKYTKDLEHAVNRCIRHSGVLTVSPDGWSYLTDVAYVIWESPGLYYNISRNTRPTEAEIMYAIQVSQSEKDNFQASAICGDRKELNIMIRAVPGHSGKLGDQIEDDKAFTRVRDLEAISHYSKVVYLDSMIGVKGKGIIPGGVHNKSDRAHVYCVPKAPPKNGSLPNEFPKGTDCVVELSPVAVQKHSLCYQTANDTVLIGTTVEVRDLLRVTLLGDARYTIWTNPTLRQMRGVEQLTCVCAMCGTEYSSGTIWCYNLCWPPLTWLGVHQRIVHIVDPETRKGELMAIYGITSKELQANQDVHGSSTRSLPKGTYTAACKKHGLLPVRLAPAGTGSLEAAAKRQRIIGKSTPSGPPPAMAAPQAGPQRATSSVSTGKSPRDTAASSSVTLTPRGSVAAILTPRREVVSESSGPSPTGPGPAARARRVALCAQKWTTRRSASSARVQGSKHRGVILALTPTATRSALRNASKCATNVSLNGSCSTRRATPTELMARKVMSGSIEVSE